MARLAGSVRGLLQCLVAFSVGVYVGLFLVSTSSPSSSPRHHSDAAAGAHLHSAQAAQLTAAQGAPKLPILLESRGAGVSVVSSRNVRAHGRALTGAGDAGPSVAGVVPSAGAAAAGAAAAVHPLPVVCVGFAMHPGKDIRGFDIDARSSSSAADCCNLCRSEQGGGGAGTGQADCTGFVFNVDRCWLKTGDGASLELLPSDRPGIVAGVAQSAVAAAAAAGTGAVPVAAMAVQQAAQSPQTVVAAVAAAPAAVSPTLPLSAVPAATSPPVAPPTPPLPPASASLTSLQNLLLLGRGGVTSPDRAAHRRFGKVELAACLKKHYGGSLAFGGDSQVRRQRCGWVGGWVVHPMYLLP